MTVRANEQPLHRLTISLEHRVKTVLITALRTNLEFLLYLYLSHIVFHIL